MIETRDLTVIGSQIHIPYIIALRHFNNIHTRLDLVVLNQFKVSPSILNFLVSLNIHLLSLSDARKNKYHSVYLMPSNILFANTKPFLELLSFKELMYCADGFRNGVHFDPNVSPPKKVIYWGFFLREKSFWDEISLDTSKIEVEVIPINNIALAWKSLIQISIKEDVSLIKAKFQPTDCLVVLRHWGSFQYGLSGVMSMGDIVARYVGNAPAMLKITVKSNPYGGSEGNDIIHSLKKIKGNQSLSFQTWEDAINMESNDSWILNPESLILSGCMGPLGTLVAFDSSINAIAAVYLKNTEIVWPDTFDTSNIFLQNRAESIIKEQSRWMRELRNENPKSLAKVVLNSDGYSIAAAVNEVYLKQLDKMLIDTNARANEIADTDFVSLTQERDALAQERDALTQERDALTQSTIWRLSKPFRLFVSKIKHLFK